MYESLTQDRLFANCKGGENKLVIGKGLAHEAMEICKDLNFNYIVALEMNQRAKTVSDWVPFSDNFLESSPYFSIEINPDFHDTYWELNDYKAVEYR